MAYPVNFPSGYDSLDTLIQTIKTLHPKVKIYYKSSSLLMVVIYYSSFMWIWQNRFFSFHTTIGNKIYLANDVVDRCDWKNVYIVIRHEFVHVLQRAKWGLLYDVSYVFPQVLALGAISAIWGPPWFLFFLAFLAPFPAPWRMKWEMEAYTATLLTHFEIWGEIQDYVIEDKAQLFYTSSYYFMWPFKVDSLRRLKRIANKIRWGKIKGIYIDIYS